MEPISLAKTLPLVEKLAATFVPPAKGAALRAKEKLEVKFRKGFTRFFEENLDRFSTVKTIISSSTPIPLLTLYVNLYVQREEKLYRDEDFLREAGNFRNVLFTATAGSGKSMLMRYLYLRFLETQTDRLPIFVELRELNERPTISLQEYIQEKIADYLEGFSNSQLKYALNTGRVVLFLDGFDEINYDIRNERERQINELARRFKELWMFVSSRPAETFASWDKFSVFNVQPFTRKQVELLISNISYDEEIKALFRKKLAEGLYETHKEFLTNPLLTIMMLITLEQFAEIPAKIHLFYEYAFEALFGRHDATKGGGFQRKRHTNLALDDFKRLFAYFCAITYMRKLTKFSSAKALELIQQSITSSQINTDKLAFKGDLTECTCMLILDGLDYTFSHRSFQEYFTAYFLARIKVDEFERALPLLVQGGGFDNVLQMVSEMNNEKFEEAWAAPTLEAMCFAVKDIDARKNCVGFARVIIRDHPELHLQAFTTSAQSQAERRADIQIFFGLVGEGRHDKSPSRTFGDERVALYSVYNLFARIGKRLHTSKVLDEEIRKKILSGDILGDDPRFDAIRKSPNGEEGKAGIPLTDADSKWIADTYFGKFMQIEQEELLKLKHEVVKRVERRKRELAKIFPFASEP